MVTQYWSHIGRNLGFHHVSFKLAKVVIFFGKCFSLGWLVSSLAPKGVSQVIFLPPLPPLMRPAHWSGAPWRWLGPYPCPLYQGKAPVHGDFPVVPTLGGCLLLFAACWQYSVTLFLVVLVTSFVCLCCLWMGGSLVQVHLQWFQASSQRGVLLLVPWYW